MPPSQPGGRKTQYFEGLQVAQGGLDGDICMQYIHKKNASAALWDRQEMFDSRSQSKTGRLKSSCGDPYSPPSPNASRDEPLSKVE